jgi:hypothetical protein
VKSIPEQHWLTPALKAQMDADDAHSAFQGHLEDLSATLQRCRFCGGEALLVDRNGEITAECDNCGIRTGVTTPERAVATWNQVPPESPLVEAGFTLTPDNQPD